MDSEPVSGVRVRVRVYGNVEMGAVAVAVAAADEPRFDVAAGSVLNLSPVDMPTSEETGE